VASQVVGSTNIPASPGTFKAASEAVSRFRNMAKFLLGNVTKPVDTQLDPSNWRFLDRLMLHRLFSFQVQVFNKPRYL
jgi:isoleucyl-tRNA synthetase